MDNENEETESTVVEIEEKTTERADEDTEIYKGKDLLIDIETYLRSGIHLGTKFKSGEMRRYIFKKRNDDNYRNFSYSFILVVYHLFYR